MAHTLCITKVFNDALLAYKKNWKQCLMIGTLVGGFWLVENIVSSKMSNIATFCKYELPQSKNSVSLLKNLITSIQYHLALPLTYKDYLIFFTLVFVFFYMQLCISRFFILLYSNKSTSNLFDALISLGTFARAIAAYLFVGLTIIVFTTLGSIVFKMGDWFLLSLEHKIVALAIYVITIVIPFLFYFSLLRWSAVDGSPSVSEIIDHSFASTQGNKLRILAVMILTHLLSYIVQFCFLRACYWPLTQWNLLQYGALLGVAVITPLREAIWASVYQQIK